MEDDRIAAAVPVNVSATAIGVQRVPRFNRIDCIFHCVVELCDERERPDRERVVGMMSLV